MGTKRRKLPVRRLNEPVPVWALQLLHGIKPDRRDPETEAGMFGWLIGDRVSGLPDYESDEAEWLRRRVGGI
jgi:hypothetical protein